MKTKHEIVVSLLFVIISSLFIIPTNAQDRSFSQPSKIIEAESPLLFIQNIGQFNPQIRYVVRGSKGSLFLSDNTLWYTFGNLPSPPDNSGSTDNKNRVYGEKNQGEQVSLRMSFVGSNANPVIEPFNQSEVTFSYFVGSSSNEWYTNVPVWSGVRYKDIYPGIDLELGSLNGLLRQNFVVSSNADINAVRLQVDGGDSLSLQNNSISVTTPLGSIDLPMFNLVNAENSETIRSTSQTRLDGSEIIAPFVSENNNLPNSTTQAIPTLLFSKVIGANDGGNSEIGDDIVLDNDGNIYISGYTYASTFPTTPGYDRSYNGNGDGYVLKLSPEGSLIYGTFLGGNQFDRINGMVIDQSNNILLTGYTRSTNFPLRNAFQGTFGGANTCGTTPDTYACGDAFFAKLNNSGNQLVYSSFYGGAYNDIGIGIAVHSDGFAYITGTRDRGAEGSPDNDAFVIKASPSGSTESADGGFRVFLATTTSMATGYDEGDDIVVNANGEPYIRGYTLSNDFYVSPQAYKQSLNDGVNTTASDIFVVKLTVDSSQQVFFEYSTYIGGGNNDGGSDISLGPLDSVIFTGWTESSDFPKPGSPASGIYQGRRDSFIARLNPSGSQMNFASFVGGSFEEGGYSSVLGSDGSIFITGYTFSADFPTSTDALDATCGTDGNCNDNGQSRPDDAFVTRFDANGNIIYSTFLGGNFFDGGYGIAVNSAGKAHVAGFTRSIDFPVTTGSGPRNTNITAFLSIIGEPPPPTPTPETPTPITPTPETPTPITPTPETPTPITPTSPTPETPTPRIDLRLAAYLPVVMIPIPTTPTPETPTPPPPLPLCGDEEDNDRFSEAKGILTGQKCVGFIDDPSLPEDDYYSVQLNAGQTITVVLSDIPPGAEIDLYLYNTSLDQIQGRPDLPGNETETFSYTATRSGRHLIDAYCITAGGNNTYSLQVTITGP